MTVTHDRLPIRLVVRALSIGLAASLGAACGAPPESQQAIAPAGLGPALPGTKLSYTPITPCRVVDTRKFGGAIPPGGTRHYAVHGVVTAQGGDTGGCTSPVGEPGAVQLNVTVIPQGGSSGQPYLRVHPFGVSSPLAALVNYQAKGPTIANAAIVKTCHQCAKNITIESNHGSAHVIIDVLGYFGANVAAPSKLRVGTFNILNFDYQKPDRNAPFIDQDQHLKTALNRIDADVMLFQEQASDKASWYQFITSLGGTYLADPLHTAWLCGLDYNCTAALSKYEILDTFDYHGGPAPFLRHTARVDVDVKGTLVTFYSVHLHSSDAQRRVVEAKYLRDLVNELRLQHPDRPIIVGGDFNSTIDANPQWQSPDSGDFEVPIQILLRQTDLDVVHVYDSKGRARTLHENAELQIDFVLMTSELHPHAKSPAGTYRGAIHDGPGKDGSDHLAQYVDISMAAFASVGTPDAGPPDVADAATTPDVAQAVIEGLLLHHVCNTSIGNSSRDRRCQLDRTRLLLAPSLFVRHLLWRGISPNRQDQQRQQADGAERAHNQPKLQLRDSPTRRCSWYLPNVGNGEAIDRSEVVVTAPGPLRPGPAD